MESLEIRSISVPIGLDSDAILRVQYDVASARRTYPEIVQWVREAPVLKLGSRAMEALLDVIVFWDFENDDGTLYSPTEENMSRVPIYILSRIIEAIRDDLDA